MNARIELTTEATTTVSTSIAEYEWRHERCRACRGTGVRYCCGERSAEMTCRSCQGNGQCSRIVPKPKPEVKL